MARWTTIVAVMGALWGMSSCVEGVETVDECSTNEDCASSANSCQTAVCADGECVVAPNDEQEGAACRTADMTLCQKGVCTAGECMASADPDQVGRPCEGLCTEDELYWNTAKVCDAAGACVDGDTAEVMCGNGSCMVAGCSQNGCTSTVVADYYCPEPTNEYLFAIIGEASPNSVLLYGDITVESDAAYAITRLDTVNTTVAQQVPVHGRLQYNGDDTNRIKVADTTLQFQFILDENGFAHEALFGQEVNDGGAVVMGVAYDENSAGGDFTDDYDLLLLSAGTNGLLVGTAQLPFANGAVVGDVPISIFPSPDMTQVLKGPKIVGTGGRVSFQAEGPPLGDGKTAYNWPGAVGAGTGISMFPIDSGDTFGMGFVIYADRNNVSLKTFASKYDYVQLRHAGDKGLEITSGTLEITETGDYTDGAEQGAVTLDGDGKATVSVTTSSGAITYRLVAGDTTTTDFSEVVFAYEVPANASDNPTVFRVLTPHWPED